MCLLLTRKGDASSLDDAWLRDFYKRNDDGFGFMYSVENRMYVDKSLGKVEEFIEKWRELEARRVDFVAHLRMRTHGDISLENCHPYLVLDGTHGVEMWMMHNGILSNGNTKDTSKSDTWHFINDYMRPLLDPGLGGNPDLIYNPVFKAILGSAIGGSNKLIFLDNQGRLATINKSSGKEWNGMWLSNTYAWSADAAKDEKSLPSVGKASYYSDNYGSGYRGSAVGEYVDGHWCRFDSPNHPDHKDYKGAGRKADAKKPEETKGNLTVINGGKNFVPERTDGNSQQAAIQFTDDGNDDSGGQHSLVNTADMFSVLKSAGFRLAHEKISFNSMAAFIKHFDPQTFLDLVELVHAEVIDEAVLVACSTDFKMAREILNDGYPPEDVVRRQIDSDFKKALEEAEEFDKEQEAKRLRASDPVIAQAAAKFEAERVIEQAKQSAVSAELDAATAAPEAPLPLPVLETKEIAEMGNKISDMAKSLESEPVNEETVAEEQHLAESEAAAQLLGPQAAGAE